MEREEMNVWWPLGRENKHAWHCFVVLLLPTANLYKGLVHECYHLTSVSDFWKKNIIHNSKKRKKLLPSHFVLTSGLLVSEDLTLTRVVYPTFGSILDIQGPSCTISSLPQPQNKIKQPQKGEKKSLNTLWISNITNLRIFSKTIFFG